MKLFECTIEGETPSKKNQRIVDRRTGRNFPSNRYQKWHYDSLCQIFLVPKRPILIDEPCKISLSFYHADKRRRDSDNGTSSIMDLLTDAQILKDDNWEIVREIEIKNSFDKQKARCEIVIEKLTI